MPPSTEARIRQIAERHALTLQSTKGLRAEAPDASGSRQYLGVSIMKYSLFNRVAAPMTGSDFSSAVENGMAQIERCYEIGNAAGYRVIAMSAANGYLGGNTSGVILTIHATGTPLVNGDVGDVKQYEALLDGPSLDRPVAWGKFDSKMVSSEHMSADQMDAVLERTEYAESGVAPGPAGQDQDLRRAVQAQLGFLMHGE